MPKARPKEAALITSRVKKGIFLAMSTGMIGEEEEEEGVERYLVRSSRTNSRTDVSMVDSSSRFSRPEYCSPRCVRRKMT
jgi:hypothetical protein